MINSAICGVNNGQERLNDFRNLAFDPQKYYL